MPAYYNEIDPFAAAWLRELIKAGHIAQGDVDDRSILDVSADDLRGYGQCHFFAGIGVWSHSLRRAGWSDDRPVWTGSCPCQPLSVAGLGKGHADERHLWPAFHRLIAERRPPIVLGEQVAGKDGREWFAAVRADLEADGYACGGADLSAAGVGAPHIRQRLYWLADAAGARLQGGRPGGHSRPRGEGTTAERGCQDGGLADANGRQRGGVAELRGSVGDGQDAGRPQGGGQPEPHGDDGGLEHTAGDGRFERRAEPGERSAVGGRVTGGLADADSNGRGQFGDSLGGTPEAGGFRPNPADGGADGRPGADHGFWRDTDWLYCRDGKWRPVEPGTFPLAHGTAARVGRLRGYGNAIVAPLAQTFIEAVMDLSAAAEDPAPAQPRPSRAAAQ